MQSVILKDKEPKLSDTKAIYLMIYLMINLSNLMYLLRRKKGFNDQHFYEFQLS